MMPRFDEKGDNKVKNRKKESRSRIPYIILHTT